MQPFAVDHCAHETQVISIVLQWLPTHCWPILAVTEEDVIHTLHYGSMWIHWIVSWMRLCKMATIACVLCCILQLQLPACCAYPHHWPVYRMSHFVDENDPNYNFKGWRFYFNSYTARGRFNVGLLVCVYWLFSRLSYYCDLWSYNNECRTVMWMWCWFYCSAE